MVRSVVLDAETNGLKPSIIWCICCLDVQTEEVTTFEMPKGPEVQEFLEQYDEVIGHNIISYDVVVLERLLNTDFTSLKVTDTLVMSRLAEPSREYGHSLKSWGIRLNFPKGDYNDWSKLTPEMVQYCIQDVRVTLAAYNKINEELKSFSQDSIDLEHKVQSIISKQIENGWLLDTKKAYDLLSTLRERINVVSDKVHEEFTPLPTFIKEIKPKIKMSGVLSVVGLQFLGDYAKYVHKELDTTEKNKGQFSRVDYIPFNLGSRKQIGRYLQRFGWVPKEFTATGHAMVNEAILSEIKGIDEATLIAEYLMLQKRIAQVESWVEAVEDDGRVHGYVNTLGAVTNRMTHSKPNVAQVPANHSPYGGECRACWTVPKGYKLVGCDASGLELRMLAHYMNDEEYAKEVLVGDIHTANQIAAGLPTRDMAKTFIYGYLYGAGDEKIGSIVGKGSAEGKRLKEKFLKNTPALATLRRRVEIASARGKLKGLDGRYIEVRSRHAALNTLLQSAGAIVMKRALVLIVEYADLHKLEYKTVLNCHDEWQAEVLEADAEKFGWLSASCIKAAGEYYDLRCEQAGEYKVGNNWQETH